MAIAIFAAALGIGDEWLNGLVGLTLLGFLWFVGFVPLWIIWSLSRPKPTDSRVGDSPNLIR
jgi:hypothetical protein